jgi:hypothetical protein
MMRTIYCMALALTLSAGVASAQWNPKPWQGTFTQETNVMGATQIVLDLPLPPDDKILTIEQISVAVGPFTSVYSRVFSCELQSRGQIHDSLPGALALTSVPLPEPVWEGSMDTNDRRKVIRTAPVKIHAAGGGSTFLRPMLRVRCDVADLGIGRPFTVTAVGYTTPK